MIDLRLISYDKTDFIWKKIITIKLFDSVGKHVKTEYWCLLLFSTTLLSVSFATNAISIVWQKDGWRQELITGGLWRWGRKLVLLIPRNWGRKRRPTIIILKIQTMPNHHRALERTRRYGRRRRRRATINRATTTTSAITISTRANRWRRRRVLGVVHPLKRLHSVTDRLVFN